MNKNSVFEQVRGRWGALLPLLGVPERHLTGRHVPCPICGGTDRFRFDDKAGFGTWICSQCGAGGPLKLLELLFGWGPAEVAQRLEQVMGGLPRAPRMAVPAQMVRPDPQLGITAMMRVWEAAKPAPYEGPVWHYLRTRGIAFDPSIELRERWSYDGYEMIARVLSTGGLLCQVHRTLILGDGIIKRLLMPGTHPPGSAVRLMPWVNGEALGIAEGIETAISASQCYNIPVWAALNAGRLKVFRPPPACTHLIVFADNDLNDVGKQAAIALARSLDARAIGEEHGIHVKILMPSRPEWDYNDLLLEVRSGDTVGKLGIRQ